MRQIGKMRKKIAWLLCFVLVLGVFPMMPQISTHVSAASNASSVFVDGVELTAGSNRYFSNGDTADSGPTGTYEDHNAYYDTAGELWLNNLEAHTIKADEILPYMFAIIVTPTRIQLRQKRMKLR